jgi:hypothetical protein
MVATAARPEAPLACLCRRSGCEPKPVRFLRFPLKVRLRCLGRSRNSPAWLQQRLVRSRHWPAFFAAPGANQNLSAFRVSSSFGPLAFSFFLALVSPAPPPGKEVSPQSLLASHSRRMFCRFSMTFLRREAVVRRTGQARALLPRTARGGGMVESLEAQRGARKSNARQLDKMRRVMSRPLARVCASQSASGCDGKT